MEWNRFPHTFAFFHIHVVKKKVDAFWKMFNVNEEFIYSRFHSTHFIILSLTWLDERERERLAFTHSLMHVVKKEKE